MQKLHINIFVCLFSVHSIRGHIFMTPIKNDQFCDLPTKNNRIHKHVTNFKTPPPSPTPTSLMRGRHKCMIPNKFTILQNMRYKSTEWFLYGRNTDFKLVHDLKNLVMKFHVF